MKFARISENRSYERFSSTIFFTPRFVRETMCSTPVSGVGRSQEGEGSLRSAMDGRAEGPAPLTGVRPRFFVNNPG